MIKQCDQPAGLDSYTARNEGNPGDSYVNSQVGSIDQVKSGRPR